MNEVSENPLSGEVTEPVADVELDSEEKVVKPDRFQKRIDRLTKDKYDLQARVAELEGKLSKVKPDTESLGIDDETLASFIEEKAQELATQMVQQKSFSDKCEKIFKDGTALDEGFKDVIANLNENGFSEDPDFFVQVVNSDDPVKLINYFNDNLDEMDAIKELGTVEQARALAKLEVKLVSETGKPKVSKAPEPIKPVSVTVMSGEVTPEKDVAAWVAQRNAAKRRK